MPAAYLKTTVTLERYHAPEQPLPLHGKPANRVVAASGCGPTTISSDTAGETFVCTLALADGTAISSAPVVVRRDSVPPRVSGVPDRPPDLNGWYNHPVRIAFTGVDALFTGTGTRLADHRVRNGVEYRYVVEAVDRAGNEAGSSIDAAARAPLFSPAAGTAVHGPPVLAWTRVAGTSYYNVCRSSVWAERSSAPGRRGRGFGCRDRGCRA